MIPAYSFSHITIDLQALRNNYRFLKDSTASSECSAVVKANAYGLGIAHVSKALLAEGCSTFFVATVDEALELREHLPETKICLLNGVDEASAGVIHNARITPVVNSPGQYELWNNRADFILHVDTGMNRLGFTLNELNTALNNPGFAANPHLTTVMSHLACADQPEHDLNRVQQEKFSEIIRVMPGKRYSLSNSDGIFLSKSIHYDLVRPGIALYGITPTKCETGKIKPVATLTSKIIQVREIDSECTVSYAATRTISKGSRLATISIGYADGLPFHLANRGVFSLAGHNAPVAGRVTMDLICLDVTNIPANLAVPGAEVEIFGNNVCIEELAKSAGTIPYEILTKLGRRIKREYTGATT